MSDQDPYFHEPELRYPDECQECNAVIEGAEVCEHCGTEQEPLDPREVEEDIIYQRADYAYDLEKDMERER